MVGGLVQKLRGLSPRFAKRPERASIILPFLIISIGLGVLAWRSYQLAGRMETGANSIASRYAAYASEVTARRVDAAVRGQFLQASEDWQQIERHESAPSRNALRDWLNTHEWIVSAIYVPDDDPTNSTFVSEIPTKAGATSAELTREFYSSTGTVRYTYDPARLLLRVRNEVRQQPLVRIDLPSAEAMSQQQAEVSLISNVRTAALDRTRDGFGFNAPLAPPLESYGIRAVVRTAYSGSGWENHRLMSLLLSAVAVALTALGAYLAMRGVRKESETMKLRGALIANVSHELRTPLSMIRLGAETLQRGAKLSEKERTDIQDQIHREVLHLSHLVENVLDVARIQHRQSKAMAFQPVYPSDLIHDLVNNYHSWIESKGFTVALELDEEVEEQLWDREAVSRALLNLIDNAIKYSTTVKALEVILRQTDEQVIIEVRDHGIGISSKDVEMIFDPYFRATFSDTQTRRGAGLGLTLVQQIVTSHGGSVEVESEPGIGSTFRLIFPRGSSEEPHTTASLIHAPEAF